MDLGEKISSESIGGPVPASPSTDKAKDIRYPRLSLDGKTAKEFISEHDLDLGDYVTATVRLCVTSLRKDEYGHSIGFDVESMDDIKAEEGDEGAESEDKPDDEEKILGYKRTPSAKKETPDLSAKDLE